MPKKVNVNKDALMNFIIADTDAADFGWVQAKIPPTPENAEIRPFWQKTTLVRGRHMGLIRVAIGDNLMNKEIAESLLGSIDLNSMCFPR